MDKLKKESHEQDVKGTGQNVKGKVQEGVGKLTGDEDMEARGHLNQAGGNIRKGAADAGHKVDEALKSDDDR